MTSGKHPSEKSVEKPTKVEIFAIKMLFLGVKFVVNEYVVQTFGSRTLPSEAYFW